MQSIVTAFFDNIFDNCFENAVSESFLDYATLFRILLFIIFICTFFLKIFMYIFSFIFMCFLFIEQCSTTSTFVSVFYQILLLFFSVHSSFRVSDDSDKIQPQFRQNSLSAYFDKSEQDCRLGNCRRFADACLPFFDKLRVPFFRGIQVLFLKTFFST